jgi:hypothetical protein
MSVSIAKVSGADTVFGNQRVKVRDITFDSSYPTGGESVTASDVGLKKVLYAIPTVQAVGGTQNVANVYYDPTNAVLKVFDETPAEAGNGQDLSTLVVRVVFFGY